MTLSDVSIKNPVFAWMLMAALIIFGGIAVSRMGISQMPDVDFPVVAVHLTLEGAAPEVMESDVADVIEDSVTSIQGIREVTTSCREGNAVVTIEFELDKNIDVAVQEVQTKIAQAQMRLPHEIDPPVVTKTNPEDQPIIWLALSGDKPLREMMEFTRDHLKDQLQTISGVGEVFLGGFLEPNLRIWLDAKKMAALELTVDDIASAITHEHVEMPAGRIETATKEFNVRSLGEAMTPEEFGNIVIGTRGGKPVFSPLYLKDVARVEEGLDDVRRLSRVGGKTAVGLGIRKQRGANAVQVADRVIQKMHEIQKNLPQGLSLGINFDSTKFIKESVGELKSTIVLSAILTGIVCWLFLGSWSSTLNVLLSIPTSIIGAFLILYFFGFTLNNFTLLALTLAIGIVVDDAIMVLENIVRHQEEGEDKVAAALSGARQITFSALAATLALVAIFLPVVFMKGAIGKFFFQFGVAISTAVLLSLLEALTLTPMRCSQFVTTKKSKSRISQISDSIMDRGEALYKKYLVKTLEHRWKVIMGLLLFFIISVGSAKFLRKEFIPAQDQSMFLVQMQTPVGSSISYTDEKFKKAKAYLMTRPEVDHYYAAVGGFGGGEVNTGILFVTMKPKHERKVTQEEFMAVVRKELNAIPDVKATMQDLSMRGFTAQRGFPVEFSVRGSDWQMLVAVSQKIKGEMESSPYFTDIDTDYQTNMPEVRVTPDRDKAAAHGVSIDAIGKTIQAAIGGLRVGKFTEGARRNDVRLRLRDEDRSNPEDIQTLQVRNNRGELIALSEVTDIATQGTLLKITRHNRERSIGLMANVAHGKSQAKALEAVQEIAKKYLPEGYEVVFSGSTQAFKESFSGLIFALWLGILVAYMILASQFNSFLHPVTVLLALPFSISGAFLSLLLFGQSLNIYSMIGLILLMGIVKKNSIMLVDFTNKMRAAGMSLNAALMKACPQRLRPILMTSVSTIAAAIPPAFGLGAGSETRVPMASAVIGGVMVSTLITLFVVPAAYSLMAQRQTTPSTAVR